MNKPPAAENAPLTPNEYQYCVTHACHFSIKQKVYKKMPNLSDKVWFNLKNLHASIHDSLTYNGMYGIHVHGFRGQRETFAPNRLIQPYITGGFLSSGSPSDSSSCLCFIAPNPSNPQFFNSIHHTSTQPR